ncbi:MAG: hypothetical protein Q9162_006076 [Coniocarpon cinnabarinum]
MSKYAQGHPEHTLKYYQARTASNQCQYYLPLLKPHYSILDVGCGPGTISASLASHVPHGKVEGIDGSETAIDAALAQEGLPSNCKFQVGDATNLPFPDETFDVVQTNQVLCHLPDAVGALKEFKRVLKSGGGFLALKESDAGLFVVHPPHPWVEVWRHAQVTVQRSSGAEPNAGRRLPEWALQAGFSEHSMRYSVDNLVAAGDTRDYLATAMAKRPREDERWRKTAMEQGRLGEKDMDAIVEGWEGFARDSSGVAINTNGQLVCYK